MTGPRRRGIAPASRFTVAPPPPYSLSRTVRALVRFPELVDRFEGGTYRRLAFHRGRSLLVSVSQPTRAARLRVELRGAGAALEGARNVARHMLARTLGTATDVRPFYRLIREDPILAPSARAFRGLRVSGRPDLFEALVTAVLSQQVNLAFAYDIRRELVETFGRRARIQGVLYHAFPSPRRLASETVARLRSFRLSRAKAETLLRLAHAFASGELSEEALAPLPDEAVVERLTALKGIGVWTAETALLRGLARPDAFPASDLGVVKYLAQGLLGHRSPATEGAMRGFAERWRPYRGLALVYAYAELARRAERRAEATTRSPRR